MRYNASWPSGLRGAHLIIRLPISSLLILFISTSALASSGADEYPMAIKTTGAPAIDLMYQGKAIDRDEATDIAKRGIDLSTLDSAPHDLWKPVSLPLSNAEKFNYPPEGAQVVFQNDVSPKGNYRGQVTYYGRPFRIIIDMDNHQYLMNAAMMRKLGYPVDMPKRYQQLSIRFTNIKTMEGFIDNFAFETGFSRDVWLKAVDAKNLIVTLQDVNLEYPRIDVPQLYEGKFDTDWIAGRRAMRGLIIPLMLLDIRLSEDSVNIFPWEFSRILAEHIMLKYTDVQWFKETTYEDARWAARKISKLTKEDLRLIVTEARLPEDISALLLEKITARRNHMVQMFNLSGELPSSEVKLPYVTDLTLGQIKNGKALQEKYPGYAPRFTFGDPKSPLAWNEIKHYVRMQGITLGINYLVDKANKQLQLFTPNQGLENHKQDFLDAITKHFKEKPTEPYVVPLKPWAQPLAGVNLNASRSLVTGTFFGSNSNKAQLVDTFSVGASVGVFGGIDGNTYLKNFGFGASVNYQRNYTHVRPLVASLEEVKNARWSSLFVPGFMKGMSKVLKWKIIKKNFDLFREKYYAAQTEWIKNYPTYKVKFEQDQKEYEVTRARVCTEQGYPPPYKDCNLDEKIYPSPHFQEQLDTRALYAEIIGTPLPEGRSLPPFTDEVTEETKPAVLPENLEDSIVLSTLKEFLAEIKDGEVFTITDSFVNQISPQIRIPLTTLMGMGVVDLLGSSLYNKINPSVGVSLTGEYAIVKRLMLMRHGDQFEVYDNRMKTRAFRAGADFTAWIEIAKIAAQKKGGDSNTDAMMLDLTSITDQDRANDEKLAGDRKKILQALSSLFIQNETDVAKAVAPPYAVHNDLKGTTKTAKVLIWNWTNYAETNRVKVKPPVDLLGRYDAEKEARTLFSARKMNLNGKNPYGLVGQVINRALGVNGLLDPGTNMNPAGNFLGTSNWSQVRAEAEVTEGRDFSPTLTFEERYAGWYLKKDKLLKILDQFQSEVNDLNLGSPIFRRDVFQSTEMLQAYDIRSNVILYQSGVKKFKDILLGAKSRQELLLNFLTMMNPDDYRKRCTKFFENKGVEPELEAFEKMSSDDGQRSWNRCIQPWMRKIMRHVKNIPVATDKEGTIQWLTDTLFILDKHLDPSRFLARIGKENFFMQIKVSGFRTKDENGDRGNVDDGYVTDTIGTVQKPISLGAFRDLKVFTNGVEWQISDFELQARYFGDGL